MNNKIIAGFIGCMLILTVIASATIYNIQIDLPVKTDDWFNQKMNNTGKSAGKTIEEDVINYYETEYDVSLQDKIVMHVEEAFENNDYKQLITIEKALDEILHGK